MAGSGGFLTGWDEILKKCFGLQYELMKDKQTFCRWLTFSHGSPIFWLPELDDEPHAYAAKVAEFVRHRAKHEVSQKHKAFLGDKPKTRVERGSDLPAMK